MARTVKHARLESRSARARLKRGRQPHWRSIVAEGLNVHLGYQIFKGDSDGRWILRRYIGNEKYRSTTLGRADDDAAADGSYVLSFEQAEAKARAAVDAPAAKHRRLTVRTAMQIYTDYKRALGQSVVDVSSRGTVHILPALGDLVVSELTAEVLRRWLATLAASPGQTRSKRGVPQYRPAAVGDEAVRARRASANRVLTMLKAILNHAFDEGHVLNRDAWGRKLKPFRDVEMARIRYLSVDEARRLINACTPEFRPLARAALETGARYGELIRLEVVDFDPDNGTVNIRKSKTGKGRHIVLTDEGAEFFRAHCAGRGGDEVMFSHRGGIWNRGQQNQPMADANAAARLKPPIGFHGLRHTWASLSIMNGVPLMVVAKNLGHVDTGMVEKHYGHLAPSFIVDAIRAGAPKFGIKNDKRVVPLRSKQ
jgi:integrase